MKRSVSREPEAPGPPARSSRREAKLVALALGLAACAPEPEEQLGRASSAIVNGTDSDASHDFAVLVIHYDALGKDGSAGCTGVMLAPTLVLTARHCVAITDESLACSQDGTALAGGNVKQDHDPSKLYVFHGRERPDFLAGTAKAARGAEIIDDGAKNLCNHDLALIRLDRALPGAVIAPLRLDGEVKTDEALTLVGFGITDKTTTPQVRQERKDVKVLAVGPSPSVGPSEIRVGEGGCAGDSGGPAIAASGAVVGVLSRGGNGSGATGKDNCIGGDNVYTKVSGFRDLILSAYAKAGQDPWREGQANPTLAKLGAACAANAECGSSLCDLDAKTCTQDCSSAACPSDFACVDRGAKRLCVSSPSDKSGCTTGGRGASPLALVAIASLVVACVRRRRTR